MTEAIFENERSREGNNLLWGVNPPHPPSASPCGSAGEHDTGQGKAEVKVTSLFPAYKK